MKTHLILFFILFLLFLLILKMTFRNHKQQKIITTQKNFKQDVSQPRKIFVWTFWEGTSSWFVDICLKRIRKSCEEGSDENISYIHTHLTRNNLDQYLNDIDKYDCYFNGEIALKSDVIRLYLLKKYGGLWLDASIFVMRPMNEIFLKNDLNCFQAFFNPNNYMNTPSKYNFPVIETSAMYAPPNFPLVNDWLEETVALDKCGVDEKKKYIQKLASLKHMKNLENPYHYVYFTLAKVLENKENGIQSYENITLYNTNIYNFFSNNYKFSYFLYKDTKDFLLKYDIENVTMIKFISSERKNIDKRKNILVPGSILKNENINIYNHYKNNPPS